MDQLETWLAGELKPYLASFGRRLRLRDGWLLAQRSLWAACLAGVLIQLTGRVWPMERLWLWTLAPLALWLLAMMGISLLQPLPPMRVARRVDAELGLKERLATALTLEDRGVGRLGNWETGRLGNWETGKLENVGQSPNLPTYQSTNLPTYQPTNLPTFHSTLIALQRQDALATAQAVDPRRAFPFRWLRRPLLLTAVLVAAMIVLAVLPNPMDAVLAERAAVAQAAEEQAERMEELREEIENVGELTPEAREELLRQLAELAEQLRANPGDREEALADLSKVEEALRQELDPNADARQAALEALAAGLQALAEGETDEEADLSDIPEALEKLAEQLAEMDAAEREALAQSLAGMAARTAQAGEGDLAQALAALAQAAQSGEGDVASQAAQAAADALAQAQGELADQAALRRTLSQVQESRQAMAQAVQGQSVAQGQGQRQGQGQGQGQGQSQGQGQGQPGGGGGTQADTLPPASGVGKADRPQGEGQPGTTGELDQQIYVPWERRQGSGDEVFIPGQEAGQGETQVREQKDPLPGAPGQALVPYQEVYYNYLDAANQTMERSYIPSGLKDYVREYFSQLEP
jgi:hypothetical protein